MTAPGTIWLAFACDEWKSRDSMRLCIASSSPDRVARLVARKISDGSFAYGDESRPGPAQAGEFRDDYESGGFGGTVGAKLRFCFLQAVADGEEL